MWLNGLVAYIITCQIKEFIQAHKMKTKSQVKVMSRKTAQAARCFTRRTLLRAGVATVASVAAYGPWIVKDAFSSSGQCNLFVWPGKFPEIIRDRLSDKTGIKIHITEIHSNEQLLNKLQSTRGRGFDLITPTLSFAELWKGRDLLKPWDLDRLPMQNVHQRYIKKSEQYWIWNYELYHLPNLWGTEAIGYRTDMYQARYGDLSLGDLWSDDVKGKIMGRPQSLLEGIGRYLASIDGIQPFENGYNDEDTMRDIWSVVTDYAIRHKDWIKLFWNDSSSQQSGLRKNGVVIGQTLDSPILAMKKAGEPVNFMAPREGAFAHMDGFAMPVGVTNAEQAYELVKLCYDPEFAGEQATYAGANSTIKGAEDYMSDFAKNIMAEVYPSQAMEKLWWWPSEPRWYAEIKSEYRDKFLAA